MIKNIVWIEDDIGIIRPVVRPLENAGHRITFMSDIKTALENMDVIRHADLLLIDMIFPPGGTDEHFPRYSGLGLLEKMRNELKITTPVVILTVVTNEEAHEELKKLDVADIIHKPVRPSELKERVEKVLGL